MVRILEKINLPYWEINISNYKLKIKYKIQGPGNMSSVCSPKQVCIIIITIFFIFPCGIDDVAGTSCELFWQRHHLSLINY